MSERKQALVELRDKVKAGKIGDGLNTLSVFGQPSAMNAVDAFHGSLDAAKALHESVLPGAWFQITQCTAIPKARCTITTLDGLPKDHRAKGDDPARAWLIAILEALIAKEDAG